MNLLNYLVVRRGVCVSVFEFFIHPFSTPEALSDLVVI